MINKKKKYQRPKLKVINIDKEISLVMATSPPPDEEDPFLAPQNKSGEGSMIESKLPSSTNNPFGGGLPDYER
jgi:hypothetical protein